MDIRRNKMHVVRKGEWNQVHIVLEDERECLELLAAVCAVAEDDYERIWARLTKDKDMPKGSMLKRVDGKIASKLPLVLERIRSRVERELEQLNKEKLNASKSKR